MNTLEINGRDATKPSFVPLASDDGVWLYPTQDAQDLVDLVSDPYRWVSKVQVMPSEGGELRSPVLLDNYVITVDAATSISKDPDLTASYIIDGIDSTGYISVKMMTTGGRFQLSAPFDWNEVRAKILDGSHPFVIAKAGERAFVHLHLGTDPELRAALLCAAIENQDWLCALFDDLDLQLLDEKGDECGKAEIKFHMPAAKRGKVFLNNSPHLNIIVQGGRNPKKQTGEPKEMMMDLAVKGATTNVDACNANSGYLVENQFYMDTFVIKAYEPSPA